MEKLREISLEAYDRLIGVELADLAVEGCITKAPCGGEKAGRRSVDRGKGGIKRSTVVDARGILLGTVIAPANHHDSPRLEATLDTLGSLGELPVGRTCIWTAPTIRTPLAASWRLVGWSGRSTRRASRLRLEPGCAGLWSARIPNTTPTRSWCGARSARCGSSISGWRSQTWTSSIGGSSGKDGCATAGKADLLGNHDLLTEPLSRSRCEVE